MNNTKVIPFLFITLFLCSPLFGREKSIKKPFSLRSIPRHEISLAVNTAGYYGDISNNDLYQPFQTSGITLGMGVGYSYRFHQYLKVLSNINYLYISGDDAMSSSIPRRARNLSFKNNLIELSIIPAVPLQIIQWQNLSRRYGLENRRLTLLVGIGFAGVLSNPQGNIGSNWFNLRDYKTEGVAYSPFTFSIPALISIEVDLKKNLSLSLTYNFRYSFSDYLDDVSTVYVKHTDPIAAQLANKSSADLVQQLIKETGIPLSFAAADPGKNRGHRDKDAYFSFGVGINYKFGKERRGATKRHYRKF